MLNNNHSLKSKWYHTKSGLSCNFAIWQTKMYWLYTLALYSHWQYFTLWYDVISWNLELNTNQSIIEILLVILSHAMFFGFFMSLVFYWNFIVFLGFFMNLMLQIVQFYIHTISQNIIFFWHRTGFKCSACLTFLRFPKPHPNKFYIPRQSMYILYLKWQHPISLIRMYAQ